MVRSEMSNVKCQTRNVNREPSKVNGGIDSFKKEGKYFLFFHYSLFTTHHIHKFHEPLPFF